MKNDLKYIGKNIRAARKNKKLTIEILSELVGISESFLGTIERGESSLSIETLISICNALNISSDSIIMNRTEPLPAVADKKDTLLTMLNNASDAELDFLIDYIKFYRSRITF
ncbi:putative transcriptional regulator [uncultured Sporomusa sp.]|uniref:Putative transcriptional regulator n=1 Tax=uncultured Sporomusa sp. TaxID=307249 RepID=A0A212LY92_9FIRM|nr:helix-turn-helix transcriptional regulator [uncultured Sporomusa sp.]SCM82564.1 putative transcriptional regulator [uncultured Sporomusa sp.]